MKKLGTYGKASWLLVLVFIALTSSAQSQDVFREMDRLKAELSTLKSEVRDLRSLVLELRKAMLQNVLAPDRQSREEAAAKEKTGVKQAPPLNEEELTKTICQSVGRFFVEAEAALRSGDTSMATSDMNKALRKLNSALRDYDRTHRVNKLLNIYEGLAWSTYTAVQLQDSVAGNQDFLKVLRQHKQKYVETCPKKWQY